MRECGIYVGFEHHFVTTRVRDWFKSSENEFPIHQIHRRFSQDHFHSRKWFRDGFSLFVGYMLGHPVTGNDRSIVPNICYIYGKEVPKEDLVRVLEDSSLAERDSNVVSIETELDVQA